MRACVRWLRGNWVCVAAGITVLWAIAASLVPAMQKGDSNARRRVPRHGEVTLQPLLEGEVTLVSDKARRACPVGEASARSRRGGCNRQARRTLPQGRPCVCCFSVLLRVLLLREGHACAASGHVCLQAGPPRVYPPGGADEAVLECLASAGGYTHQAGRTISPNQLAESLEATPPWQAGGKGLGLKVLDVVAESLEEMPPWQASRRTRSASPGEGRHQRPTGGVSHQGSQGSPMNDRASDGAADKARLSGGQVPRPGEVRSGEVG